MSHSRKSKASILTKFQIKELNPMQLEAEKAIQEDTDLMLLSPTGTGKTLAFLLPLIEQLDPTKDEVQLLILVPSRELAIQINQVIREMGSGFKTNAIYGGKSGSKDRMELKHRPAILVGTPGRVADHFRRHTFSTEYIKTLVLDEFDKSLEVGFEKEMKEILSSLFKLEKRILTSATFGVEVPKFVKLKNLKTIDYLKEGSSNLKIVSILSPSKDKLDTLVSALSNLGEQSGIIFCNFKESIDRLSNHLTENNIAHACFYGGLDQLEREKALIKFRNGTHRIIIATDLAARGIDVAELDYIIHYQLPPRKEEFTHRNGRTARMNSKGTAYVIHFKEESLPDFIGKTEEMELVPSKAPLPPKWKTLFISGGRKDKISKGDVAGLFFKEGGLNKNEVGLIEIKEDCAFVAVDAKKAFQIVKKLNNSRLKTKKVRIQFS